MEIELNKMIVANKNLPTNRNETFCTSFDFAEAWSKSFSKDYQPLVSTKYQFASNYSPLAIPVIGSGSPRTMYAVQSWDKFGRRIIDLAPFGQYASPNWENELERSTLQKILKCLTGIRTREFTWNVRFDQEPLAKGLISLGLQFLPTPTHILDLNNDYQNIFAGYSSSIRNQVRKAKRRGVVVTEVINSAEVYDYYQIHTQLAENKGGYKFIYPVELFLKMIKLSPHMRMLVAKSEGKIIAGGLFYKDGCCVNYWQGTSDRNYSHLYPMRAVFDEAIRWACESGAVYFDFGGSAGLTSLKQFKSAWGAKPRENWMFEWKNPLWQKIANFKNNIF